MSTLKVTNVAHETSTLNTLVFDNGGGSGEEACDYCQGNKDRSSSDNPEKAIISLKNDRETDYKVYISVQNELVAAYNQLRNREFTRLYPEENMTYSSHSVNKRETK